MIVVVWAFISKEDYRVEAARVVTTVQALLKSRTGRSLLSLRVLLVWRAHKSSYIADKDSA